MRPQQQAGCTHTAIEIQQPGPGGASPSKGGLELLQRHAGQQLGRIRIDLEKGSRIQREPLSAQRQTEQRGLLSVPAGGVQAEDAPLTLSKGIIPGPFFMDEGRQMRMEGQQTFPQPANHAALPGIAGTGQADGPGAPVLRSVEGLPRRESAVRRQAAPKSKEAPEAPVPVLP